MTKKLVWRLSNLPSTQELRELVKDKIITQEEAREILFSSEEQKDRDKKGLESEIKFLRELVEKLSNQNNSKVVEIIREIERPYIRYDWWQPYRIWCSNDTSTGTSIGTLTTTNTDSNTEWAFTSTAKNFSDITTF